MSQAVATVDRELAWSVVDAAFTRLADAPARFFAPEVDRYVQTARRTFYDGGLQVADEALALRLAPVGAAEDPVAALEEIVSALEPLVRTSEGACRVRAFLVVAAETQRTVGFLPTVRRTGIRLRASSSR